MNRIILFLIYLILLKNYIFSFDGLTEKSDSHIEITKTSLANVFGVKFGKIVKTKTDLISGAVYFYIENQTIGDIIAFASRDIDLYFFGFLPAHAQTDKYDYNKDYSDEQLKEIETKAVFKYLKFIIDYYKKINQSFKDNDIIKGAYYFGFILHSIEDLFAHYGMTNEQHRYFDKKNKNPDYDIENIKLCRVKIEFFLKNFLDILDPDAKNNFLKSINENKTFNEDINLLPKKILKKGMDIYWEGLIYLLFTGYDEKCIKYFDKIKWDYEKIFEIILDKKLLEEVDNIKTTKDFYTFLERIKYKF